MRTRILVLTIAMTLLAAACGSSDEATGVASASELVTATTAQAGGTGSVASLDDGAGATTAPAQGEVDAETAILAFTECMRDQGVDMNDPQVDADGNLRLNFRGLVEGEIDRDAMQAARAECDVLIEGVAQRFEQVDRTAIEDGLLGYAACMRDNGYDMPDPDMSFAPGEGGGRPGGRFGDIDREDPAFVAANEVCLAEFSDLPFAGRGGPGGGGGGE